jgi:hypothetical protein
MPDLPGAGANANQYHPFCHGKSLAHAILDGIPAMQAMFRQDPYLVSGGYAWDGRLFLLGCSEGAYAPVAAVAARCRAGIGAGSVMDQPHD